MKFLGVLCVLCGLSIAGRALDREAFTFTKYDLNVRVEPEQQRLAVRGKITLRNDSSQPQTNLALQISSSLDWRAIRIDGKAAHFVTQEYDSDIDHTGALSEAIVNLSQPIPPKETLTLDIGYEGVIPLDASRLTRVGVSEDRAKHSDWDQISKAFTAVRGMGYVVWYPVATEDASLADGNSVAETIARWQAREAKAEMSGTFESTSDAPIFVSAAKSGAESQKKGDKLNFAELGSNVPTFAIANYEKLASQKKSDEVSIYYLENQREAAEAYGEVAEQIAPIVPESHAALNILALPDTDAQPFVAEGMLLTPLTSPITNEAELSIVYAKARQQIASPRAWIYDGLAHYAQAAFIETQKGRAAALEYLSSHEKPLAEAEKADSKSQVGQPLINSPDDIYLQTKAMAVWWMLRDMMGDSAFNSALLAYHGNEDNDAAYLQKKIEEASHRELQWFFDDWIYHDRGLPEFHVEPIYSTPIENGGFLVTVTVENVGNAGAEVPLILKSESAEIRKRLEVHAKSKASVRIEAQSRPIQVTVDDGSVPERNAGNNVYVVSGASQ